MRYRWLPAVAACFCAALLSELPAALALLVNDAPIAMSGIGEAILRWVLWGALFGPLAYRGAYVVAAGRRGAAVILAAALPVMLVYVWSAAWIARVIFGAQLHGSTLSLFQPMIVYTLTAGTAFFVRTEERRAAAERTRLDAEARFASARLEILRCELQPHFLFNALNTISSLATRDRDAAATVAVSLRDLFRASIGPALPQVTSVENEVGLTKKYLDVQQARFEHRLRPRFHIAPEAEQARIPSLLLQPLVENAVRHGMTRREGIDLTIAIGRSGGELQVLVVNDGPVDSRPVVDGFGLSNARARLAALYGDRDALFAARRLESGGFEVEVRIPFQSEGG